MGNIISFPSLPNEEDNILALSKSELLQLLEQLRCQVEQLDRDEPVDMESEEYEQWGDAHEALEDRIDEILDRLDDLQ